MGESDLAFDQVWENVKSGWFSPSPEGEKLMPVLAGMGPALMRLHKMMRSPVREMMRGLDREPEADFPRDIRQTTAYADLVSLVDEREAMNVELRDPEGNIVATDDISIDDTEWKMALGSRRMRRTSRPDPDVEAWDPTLGPRRRYQLQVRLRGVPRRRHHVPLEDAEA